MCTCLGLIKILLLKKLKELYRNIVLFEQSFDQTSIFSNLNNHVWYIVLSKTTFHRKIFFFDKANYICQLATYVYKRFKQYAKQITIKTDTMTVALFSSLLCQKNCDLSIILMSFFMSVLYWQINISYIVPRVSEFKEDGWIWRTKCPFNTEYRLWVRIEITCIYDRVLLIHVDTCSTTPPHPTSLL